MKCGARMAGAMATGYMLGRTKKMKLALMMGSWAAGQKFGSPAELLSKGTELLRNSPEFAQLNDEVRVKLIDAGKAAVTAAATQRLTKLTDSVGSSAERVAAGGPLRVARHDDDDGDEKPSRRSLLRFRRRGDADSASVEEEADDVGPEDATDEDATEEDATLSESAEDGTDEDGTDEVVDEDDEEPAPKRRRTPAKTASGGEKAPAKRAPRSGTSAARSRAPRTSAGAKTAAKSADTAKPDARGGRPSAARSGAK